MHLLTKQVSKKYGNLIQLQNLIINLALFMSYNFPLVVKILPLNVQAMFQAHFQFLPSPFLQDGRNTRHNILILAQFHWFAEWQ